MIQFVITRFKYNTDCTPNDHLGLIFLINYTFYSRYNVVLIANREIGSDLNNSVIKLTYIVRL